MELGRKNRLAHLEAISWREYLLEKGSQLVSILISSLQLSCMLSGQRKLGFNDENGIPDLQLLRDLLCLGKLAAPCVNCTQLRRVGIGLECSVS